ncbi:LPS translocon maturation chaperone LptM [Francisella sp. TX07-6608]|uniref:LPS translocon maturation chaperone LptM n=1 Tax=Francisella sp. TX07-6608 TaxID=573568 RepID=UPI0008F9B183|nr:lipoprotein [Francisella sp. TX07-6608]OIN84157.1 prokaryotic lipo-attachment site family protein [Francisella sp. TX07-6608]
MKKQLFVISITTAILVLSACGQTGPLYLPDEDKLNSRSTLAKSGSSIMVKQNQQNNSTSTSDNQSDTSTKVDNDPTAPVRNNNPTASELFEGENNFNYNNNIQNSQNAGGTPTL